MRNETLHSDSVQHIQRESRLLARGDAPDVESIFNIEFAVCKMSAKYYTYTSGSSTRARCADAEP
jgi:hypothetical protein